jgi:proteasome assembly chaperone (PAC2) family protein
MDHVRWSERPQLDHPVLIAAFEGWNDAGDAASGAVRFLRDRWGAEPFAHIDCEEYFDFSSTRPQVRLDEDGRRVIDWPTTEFSAARVPGTDIDVVLVLGTEPQLRWQSYCRQVLAVAEATGAKLAVTLGALLADVPHSRPVSVIGTSEDDLLRDRYALRRSTYEGPTGIVGVLAEAFGRQDLPATSLWAAVPSYVPAAPSPKATLALVRRVTGMLQVDVMATDLEIASASYERQITELVEDDDDTVAYVRHLEERVDAAESQGELLPLTGLDDDDDDPMSDAEPDADALVQEVERYLRLHQDEE